MLPLLLVAGAVLLAILEDDEEKEGESKKDANSPLEKGEEK